MNYRLVAIVSVVFFMLNFSTFAVAKQQQKESEAAKRLIAMTKKRNESFIKGGDLFTRVSTNQYSLDHYFRPVDIGFEKTKLREDQDWQRFILDDDVVKELQLDPGDQKRLQEKAKLVNREWKRLFDNFGIEGDQSLIPDYMKLLSDFENEVESTLGTARIGRLRMVQYRYKFDQNHLAQLIELIARRLGIQEAKVKKCLVELAEEIESIKQEGNRFLVKEIQELLPHYLDEIAPDELERLPLLPMGHLLAIMEKPDLTKKSLEYWTDSRGYKITAGDRLYNGPVFAKSRSAGVSAWMPSFSRSQPRSPWFMLGEQVNLELVGQQKDVYEALVVRQAKSQFPTFAPVHLTGVDSTLLKDLGTEDKIVKWMSESLMPPQKRALANYCRLHSLFVFGPDLIRDRMEAEKNDSVEDFGKKREVFVAKVRKQISQSQKRFLDKLWQHLGDDFEPEFDRTMFLCVGSNCYQSWINSFIKVTRKNGRK